MIKRVALLVIVCSVPIPLLNSYAGRMDTPGPNTYVVGYRSIRIENFGRPYSTGPLAPRILPLHIWYPSTQTKGRQNRVKFQEYLKDEQHDSWDSLRWDQVLKNTVAQFSGPSSIENTVTKLAEFETASIRNSDPARGKFPVLLISGGLTSPGFIFSSFAEDFARRGYVVVSYPNTPDGKGLPMTFDERGIDVQIKDIEMIIDHLISLPFSD